MRRLPILPERDASTTERRVARHSLISSSGTIESRPLLAHPGEGEEHRLEIAVFSRAASRDEAGGILSRAVDLLVEGSGMAGALAAASPGHDLVGVRLIDLRSERLVPQRLWRAGARFRLVTEPLA